MHRGYEKWFSPSLGREMEMLVFGHGGLPVLVFPTSCGRYFEFENRDMVSAVGDKVERGELQFFCVDSVDAESWYNRDVPPRWRIARQLQYQAYILDEVVPYVKRANWNQKFITLGCSFGGYHAANLAFKHPDVFTGMLSLSGAFDVSSFLHGYHDQDVYYNMPPQYLAHMSDSWFLDRYRQNSYVLATGEHDQCWNANERLASVMRGRGIPVRLDVWGNGTGHDWPWWQEMMRVYL
jgi:esterase/lipase superfamily enzyme